MRLVHVLALLSVIAWNPKLLAVSAKQPKCNAGFCLAPKYNNMDLPGMPTKVRVSLFVNDITSIKESSFSMTVHTYVALKWKEPRLLKNDARSYHLLWCHTWTPGLDAID